MIKVELCIQIINTGLASIYNYLCIYVCMCVCIYVCMCIYMHIPLQITGPSGLCLCVAPTFVKIISL